MGWGRTKEREGGLEGEKGGEEWEKRGKGKKGENQQVAFHRKGFGGKKPTTADDVASEIHKQFKCLLEQPLRTHVLRNIHLPPMFVRLCADFQNRLRDLTSGSGTYDVVEKDIEPGSQRLRAIWTEEVAQRLPALVTIQSSLHWVTGTAVSRSSRSSW